MAKKRKMRLSHQLAYNNEKAKEIWGWGWGLTETLKDKARRGEFSWEDMNGPDIDECVKAIAARAPKVRKHIMDGNWLIALEYIKAVKDIAEKAELSLTKKIRKEHGWNW